LEVFFAFRRRTFEGARTVLEKRGKNVLYQTEYLERLKKRDSLRNKLKKVQ